MDIPSGVEPAMSGFDSERWPGGPAANVSGGTSVVANGSDNKRQKLGDSGNAEDTREQR